MHKLLAVFVFLGMVLLPTDVRAQDGFPPGIPRREGINILVSSRFCSGDLYPAEYTFMCGARFGFPVMPQGREWKAHLDPAVAAEKKIRLVVLWTPRFLGWTLIVFAPDNGCMKFGGLDAYCIQYDEYRDSFRAWSHPALPELQGFQVILEDDGIPGVGYPPAVAPFEGHQVFVPLLVQDGQ